MGAVALIATLNGIIVQIIMSSRVLYGLAKQHDLPGLFAKVHQVTHTPLYATAFTTILVLVLALAVPCISWPIPHRASPSSSLRSSICR